MTTLNICHLDVRCNMEWRFGHLTRIVAAGSCSTTKRSQTRTLAACTAA